MAIEDGVLWIADSHNNNLFLYHRSPELILQAIYALPAQASPKPIAALAWHEKSFWIAREGSSVIWKRPARRLQRQKVR